MADEIIKVIDELCKKFGIAVDWTSENVMPYIQQLCEKYIQYEIWTSVGWIVLWGIILIGSIIFFANRNKAMKLFIANEDEDNCWEDAFDYPLGWGWILSVMLFVIVLLIFAIVTISQSMDIITCLTFPEKMIFEYVQALLSSDNM